MQRFLAVGRPVIPCVTAFILTLALTSWGARTGSAGALPSAGAAPATAAACTVRETSRSPLVVDGTREMYVEPMVVRPSRGEILLAGSPNYLYAPGRADEPRDFVRDSVFGAILGADGRARLVAAPIDPTRITSVHAAALPAGGWAVVFAELKHAAAVGTPDSLVRFWHAVHDGHSWTRLEQLPVPADGAFLKAGASDLILRGDTSFFAARVATRNGSHDIALFERRQGRWMLDMLPVRSAAYVQLGYADSLGLLIGVVRPDITQRADENSLFVHPRGTLWSVAPRIARGLSERVHAPSFSASSLGPVLTWSVRVRQGQGTRAIVGRPHSDAPVIALDSAISHVSAVASSDLPPIWVVEHVGSPEGAQLRVLVGSVDRAAEVARIASPYTGWFTATAPGPDQLLVSGPLLRRESANPSLATLLIRFRVDCAAGAPRSDGWTLARRVYVHPSRGGLDDSLPAFPRALRLRDVPARLRERERPHRARILTP